MFILDDIWTMKNSEYIAIQQLFNCNIAKSFNGFIQA